MTKPIDLTVLRAGAEAEIDKAVLWNNEVVLRLIDAVEAAHAFYMREEQPLYEPHLEQALRLFTFRGYA